MPRFFISSEQIDGDKITLAGDDAHHVARSLRMAAGECITVCCTADASEYECTIDGFDADKQVFLNILSKSSALTEPPMKITLFQALSKGDKLDTVIQKSVECGVSLIVPFESERCVVKAKDESEARKTERRRRIALEAAKQSGRGILPDVSTTLTFDNMLSEAEKYPLVFFCYEGDGTQPIGKLLAKYIVADADGKYPNVALIVGSEGGFSPEETAKAAERGFLLTGLGKRILRTETAPIFALSCIICAAELS